MAVVTVTVTAHADDPYAAMSTSGSSSILVGVGLAVLAPCCCAGGSCVAPAGCSGGAARPHLARVQHRAGARTCSPACSAR